MRLSKRYRFMVRVSGVLIENDSLLIIKQNILGRTWYLPGGKLEIGESLRDGIAREYHEETGLVVQPTKLVCISDTFLENPSVLHILFVVKRETGKLQIQKTHLDNNPIHDIAFVKVDDLQQYGFSDGFVAAIKCNFSNIDNYVENDTFFDFNKK